MNHTVQVWEESISIPTYPAAEPETSPLFLENRAYQGSTGRVYPFPVTEKISDTKTDVSYQAVWLENDYLKIMILPELGGRIQRALDKTNGYDFVYYNRVIKPALVGLTGPWISGGIEFNWPQHHRPSTDLPVDYTWKSNADGSATVFVSEIDRMYGTKGMASFTLYPDKAYLEIQGQLYNPTDLPQTFLWWANPAVSVNQHTYSVFPPDVQAVMDHGKRAVSTFPIATGEYYKYDYSEGVDISCYRNVPVPTSYMAAHSDYDFIGNYDEEKGAGLLHVADHHISPGKKQWTWGNSDFGRAWDRNLTDEDGPYIELMTGVFADNQPDFTWLKPHEEKTFTQYFMPYKQVGRVKNATKDAAVGISLEQGHATVRLYTTSRYEHLHIKVSKASDVLFEDRADVSPTAPYEASFDMDADDLVGCSVSVWDSPGNTLVSYTEAAPSPEPIPDPAEVLPAPEKIPTTEELYLAGEHLEQYRHATYRPEDYYLEGLKRDPMDIRLNNCYGLLQYRRGNFEEAAACFRRAISRQTWLTPNPYAGECCFNLGLTLFMMEDYEKAYDAFYKSTWSSETQANGFYWLAALAARKKDWDSALAFIEKSLLRGLHNMRARTLKAAILRKMGRSDRAWLLESEQIDPLYMGTLFEKGLLSGSLADWKKKMRTPVHNYLELALDYMKMGFYEDAILILEQFPGQAPMAAYYRGYCRRKLGSEEAARMDFLTGEACDWRYCFPNRTEEILILKTVISTLDTAPRARYYLGCLLYDKRQDRAAIQSWEASAAEDPSFGLTFRNLAIAYYNKEGNVDKALRAMETAFRLMPTSRMLQELDQLCSKAGHSMASRLACLEANLPLVFDRDVLTLEYITLLNSTGQYKHALELLMNRRFHPWEGGEGKVSAQYRFALTRMAEESIQAESYEEAIDLLERTKFFPENLGEGKLPNTLDTEADYLLGCIYEVLGDCEKAQRQYALASVGLTEVSSVLYYNDQPSDTMYYQGLANRKLGKTREAGRCFHQLLTYGRKHIFDRVNYDYFAVSLPEIEVFPTGIQTRNDLYCHYLMGLGYLGLGQTAEAVSEFHKVLDVSPDYQGAVRFLRPLQ